MILHGGIVYPGTRTRRLDRACTLVLHAFRLTLNSEKEHRFRRGLAHSSGNVHLRLRFDPRKLLKRELPATLEC